MTWPSPSWGWPYSHLQGAGREDQELIDGTYLYMRSVYDYFGDEYDGDPVSMMYEDGYITAEDI